MTPKQYLQRAFFLDQQINNKLDQVAYLNCLACKVTSTLSDMPIHKKTASSTVEDIILNIVTLQEEVNQVIDELVDIKREIVRLIHQVESIDVRMVLEKRYLNFKTFEQIAVDLNFTIRHVYRLHNRGLAAVGEILERCQ